MFTAFNISSSSRYEGANDILESNKASYSGLAQYSRTACDICRARKLKCIGTGATCDECSSASSRCTYTFSSGIGPGKKRRRRVLDPTLNTDISHYSPVVPHKPALPESTNTPDVTGTILSKEGKIQAHPRELSGLEPTPAASTPGEPATGNSDSRTGTEPSSRTISPSGNPGADFSGATFALCPGKHISAVTLPQAQLELEQVFDFGIDAVLSPLNQTSRESQHDSFGQCSCVASMEIQMQDLNSHTSVGTESLQTDALFFQVEQGIDSCSTLTKCGRCNVNDLNPMLLVNHMNQLALMLDELVHRLISCQSADTAPALFQFGGYSVQKTTMRTRLLTSMIGLHVDGLNKVLVCLGNSLTEKARPLLAGAQTIVTKMGQTLLSFSEDPRGE